MRIAKTRRGAMISFNRGEMDRLRPTGKLMLLMFCKQATRFAFSFKSFFGSDPVHDLKLMLTGKVTWRAVCKVCVYGDWAETLAKAKSTAANHHRKHKREGVTGGYASHFKFLGVDREGNANVVEV